MVESASNDTLVCSVFPTAKGAALLEGQSSNGDSSSSSAVTHKERNFAFIPHPFLSLLIRTCTNHRAGSDLARRQRRGVLRQQVTAVVRQLRLDSSAAPPVNPAAAQQQASAPLLLSQEQ